MAIREERNGTVEVLRYLERTAVASEAVIVAAQVNSS
jgi:hypothetical protein